MAATASIVPELPTARSKPTFSISRAMGVSIERMKRRQASTAPGCRRSVLKNRWVSRMAPSLKLRAASGSLRSPTSTSVLPPPMSMSSSRRSKAGTPWRMPR